MEVKYKTRKLEKICTDVSKTEREYGIEMAIKIHQRIGEIQASKTVELMIQCHIGRCHMLVGNRKGQYAMDLVHPARLVFIVDKQGLIQIAEIVEIVDYHK